MTKRLLFMALMAAATPLFAQQNPAGDALLFLEGLNLSYNNRYAEATAKFQEYRGLHPDDPLVTLRILCNRFFETNHGRNLSKEDYRKFIIEISTAIEAYEKKDCYAIDFATTGRSIDCDYVGAALYSLRAALHAQEMSYLKSTLTFLRSPL